MTTGAVVSRELTRLGRLLVDGPVTTHTRATGEVVVSGLGCHTTQVGAVWFREQVTAMAANPDEPVVPIVVPGGWSGFGLVTGATVEPLAMSDGYQRWSVTVAPVRNPGAPVIESGLLMYLRANANALSQGTWVHAVPAEALSYSWVPAAGSVTAGARATDPLSPAGGGDVWYRQVGSGADGATSALWSVAPGHYYDGACYAEAKVGPDWLPVVGRSTLTPEGWRIGNGLVRFTVEGPSLTISWYRPDRAGTLGGWTAPTRWHLRRTDVPSTTNWDTWTAFEVTEMSAHKVTCRFTAQARDGRCTVWATLQRGTRTVSFHVDSDVPDPRPWMMLTVTTTATDNTYYGQSATVSADGGLRWLYMASSDFTVATSSGNMGPSASSAAQWPFGISAILTGDLGTAAIVAREWYTPVAERVIFR
jgi:hypothetical protein